MRVRSYGARTGLYAGFWPEAPPGHWRWVGVSRQGVAIHIDAWGIIGWVDNAKLVVFPEEGLLVHRAYLYIIDSLDVREIRTESRIGERPELGNGRGLQVWRTEIGKRVATRVVVVGVPADVAAEVEDRVVADHARIGWRDIEGHDFGSLIGIADIAKYGIAAGAATDDIRDIQVVIRIGCLEPGTRVVEIDMNRIDFREVVVDPVEDIFFVAFVMEDHELGRIEKSSGVQSIGLDEVPPVLAAVAQIEPRRR